MLLPVNVHSCYHESYRRGNLHKHSLAMLSMHPNQSLGPEKDPGANLRLRLSAQRDGGGGGRETGWGDGLEYEFHLEFYTSGGCVFGSRWAVAHFESQTSGGCVFGSRWAARCLFLPVNTTQPLRPGCCSRNRWEPVEVKSMGGDGKAVYFLSPLKLP